MPTLLRRHSTGRLFDHGRPSLLTGRRFTDLVVLMKSLQLTIGAGLLLLIVGASGCSPDDGEAITRITPEYDKGGRLHLLKDDSKGLGKVDTWSYMDGARVVRIEIDTDDDGQVDWWEHYGADQKLEKIGLSRRKDGHEDAWTYTGADGAVERIDVSTHRDGRIDRTEYYEHGAMVRAEEDSDADGRMDKWETYDGARLTSVAFDTLHRGVPDCRLTYGLDGSVRLNVERPTGTATKR